MLDYKDILTKRYALGMSGLAIAKSLNASVSGVNDFLRRFEACKSISFPLPEGITNYGIATAVYGRTPAVVGRDFSYEQPDYASVTYMNFEDRDLRKKMYHQQDKKSPMTVYFDPRDNSRIFYKDSENQLAVARLNTLHKWQKDLEGRTLDDTNQYFHEKAIADKKAVHRNDQIGAYQFEAIESVVNEAAKGNGSNKASAKTEHIRKARREEQQLVSRRNAITDRLDPPNGDMDADMALPTAQALPGDQAANGIEEKETFFLEDYNDIAAHFDEYFDT